MNNWRPIKTAPKDRRRLLTNNLHARDAHGQMSHVWIGYPIRRADGEWVTFDDYDVRARNLTHWHPLPTAPGEE